VAVDDFDASMEQPLDDEDMEEYLLNPEEQKKR
jgi:hypothetical protein